MTNYDTSSNIEIYLARKEPVILHDAKRNYINLRSCDTPEILEDLEKKLKEYKAKGRDVVICPWLSPPFNKIVGYGEYTRRESAAIRRRQSKEEWGHPRFGRSYGLQEIQALLEQCRTISCSSKN